MLFEHTKCKKCNHINPAYKNICSECKSYLRERVVNIDLWNTIQQIIETPAQAFKQIIFAEHKNFIIFITFFIAVKNLVIIRFLSVPALGLNGVTSPFVLSLTLTAVLTFLLLGTFVFFQIKFFDRRNVNLRFKDIYAVNVYSFIPYIFGLVFIFPVELIVLGGDIFSNNPYSFEIKPLITYILIAFELITILWSFFLIFKSLLTITSIKSISLLISLAYFCIWFASLYLSSKLFFTV